VFFASCSLFLKAIWGPLRDSNEVRHCLILLHSLLVILVFLLFLLILLILVFLICEQAVRASGVRAISACLAASAQRKHCDKTYLVVYEEVRAGGVRAALTACEDIASVVGL
jgi:hypothetical protein